MIAKGDRVQIVESENNSVELSNGEKGTVKCVRPLPMNGRIGCKIDVSWDNGDDYELLEGIDNFRKI
jgi:hypothetical protein